MGEEKEKEKEEDRKGREGGVEWEVRRRKKGWGVRKLRGPTLSSWSIVSFSSLILFAPSIM